MRGPTLMMQKGRADRLPGARFPHAGGAIEAGGDDAFSIMAEFGVEDRIRVSSMEKISRGGVPNLLLRAPGPGPKGVSAVLAFNSV